MRHPTRMRQRSIAFEDLTRPSERTFGVYEVRIIDSGFTQLIRASHPTAARIARSRTLFGDSELSFVDAIDTPALD